MSLAVDSFHHFAQAEKQLSAEVGPDIATMIRAIEDRVGVPINEIRIVGTHEPTARWLNATCTLIS